jgi:hypothetical protein
MDIDEEYRVDEPSVTPAETPTPTATVATSNTSGIKIKLTLNKNKEASSSSSTTTNAEAGPSNARSSTRSKRTAAQAKADAAFEDDASQASVNTAKGKSHKKKVKLNVSGKPTVVTLFLNDIHFSSADRDAHLAKQKRRKHPMARKRWVG